MNTGYKINEYMNTNIYSPTYGVTQQERVLDLENCAVNDYALVIEIEIPENNYTWESRLYTNLTGSTQYYEKTIDWGDGQKQNLITNIRPAHTYANAGTYRVTYYAPVIGSRSVASNDDKLIKKVISWGNSAAMINDGYDALFKDCDIIEIASFPTNYFNNYIATWNASKNYFFILNNCFENNTNLISIPDNFGIDINIINRENFVQFSLNGMFKNTGIRKIPKGFLNLNNIQFYSFNLSNMFYNCNNLTEIDADAITGINNLGNGNHDFSSMFYNCNLNSMPNLFNEFRIPTSSENQYYLYFLSTFYNNSNMTGEALPYWNIYNSNFITLGNYNCYKNCTALTNYNDIPIGWK